MNRNILSIPILLFFSACANQEQAQEALLPHSIKAGPDQQQARGIVFHDLNDDRIMDDNEKGEIFRGT